MPRRKDTRNRTNPNSNTISQQKERANAAIDGRGGRKAAYTGGARTASKELYEKAIPSIGFKGYKIAEDEANRRAYAEGRNLQVYTRTRSGRLSINGKDTNGAVTNAMTPKNDDGTPVLNQKGEARRSGRESLATRRQREYDVRKGLNNITQRAMDAMVRAGLVRQVDGNLVGNNGNVITRKADGNYTMGLTTG